MADPNQPAYPPPGVVPPMVPNPAVPVQGVYAAPLPQEWSSDLCDCCTDCRSCWCSMCCPCCVMGENYEAMGMGSKCGGCCLSYVLSIFLCNCILGTSIRGNMRSQYNLQGSCCKSCCAYFWCQCCAIAQDAREIKKRKVDGQFVQMAATTAAPPAPQEMAKQP